MLNPAAEDRKDNIMVMIRIKPCSEAEASKKSCVVVEKNKITYEAKEFSFDYVADEKVDQEGIFEFAGRSLVDACLNGYNATVFAYGQTGSGKTYTIQGPTEERLSEGSLKNKNRGLMQRMFECIFSYISKKKEEGSSTEYIVKCSYLEIYQETIMDLLYPTTESLHIREDIKKGVYVDGLTEEIVESCEDTFEIIQKGIRNRHVGATAMNKESSRSHSVLILVIESKSVKDGSVTVLSSRFHIIDLAGSERQKSTEATGERLKEAGTINKSLSTLGSVIKQFVERSRGKTQHINYRDSKLTFLLKDSIGGNSKTVLIANISRNMCSAADTLSTLNFAKRAKRIKNRAVINQDVESRALILQEEIKRLTAENAELKARSIQASIICKAEPESDKILESGVKKYKDLGTLLQKTLELRASDSKMYEQAIKAREKQVCRLKKCIQRCQQDMERERLVAKLKDSTIARLEAQKPLLISEQVDMLKQEIQALREAEELSFCRILKEITAPLTPDESTITISKLSDYINQLSSYLEETAEEKQALLTAIKDRDSCKEEEDILISTKLEYGEKIGELSRRYLKEKKAKEKSEAAMKSMQDEIYSETMKQAEKEHVFEQTVQRYEEQLGRYKKESDEMKCLIAEHDKLLDEKMKDETKKNAQQQALIDELDIKSKAKDEEIKKLSYANTSLQNEIANQAQSARQVEQASRLLEAEIVRLKLTYEAETLKLKNDNQAESNKRNAHLSIDKSIDISLKGTEVINGLQVKFEELMEANKKLDSKIKNNEEKYVNQAQALEQYKSKIALLEESTHKITMEEGKLKEDLNELCAIVQRSTEKEAELTKTIDGYEAKLALMKGELEAKAQSVKIIQAELQKGVEEREKSITDYASLIKQDKLHISLLQKENEKHEEIMIREICNTKQKHAEEMKIAWAKYEENCKKAGADAEAKYNEIITELQKKIADQISLHNNESVIAAKKIASYDKRLQEDIERVEKKYEAEMQIKNSIIAQLNRDNEEKAKMIISSQMAVQDVRLSISLWEKRVDDKKKQLEESKEALKSKDARICFLQQQNLALTESCQELNNKTKINAEKAKLSEAKLKALYQAKENELEISRANYKDLQKKMDDEITKILTSNMELVQSVEESNKYICELKARMRKGEKPEIPAAKSKPTFKAVSRNMDKENLMTLNAEASTASHLSKKQTQKPIHKHEMLSYTKPLTNEIMGKHIDEDDVSIGKCSSKEISSFLTSQCSSIFEKKDLSALLRSAYGVGDSRDTKKQLDNLMKKEEAVTQELIKLPEIAGILSSIHTSSDPLEKIVRAVDHLVQTIRKPHSQHIS